MKLRAIFPGLNNLTRQFVDDWRKIGVAFALRAACNEIARQFKGRNGPVKKLRVRNFAHPIHYRTRGSDLKVIRQVFFQDGFSVCRSLSDVKRVIDCGGNIGLASIMFLESWPESKVVIVEPDAGNMAMCRRNLAPYGDRVSYYQYGIWTHSCRLAIDRGPGGSSEEWSFTVKEADRNGAGDVDAIDLGSLMDREGFDRVDYIKLDIEGTEEKILLPEFLGWIDRTTAFSVELHSEKGRQILEGAMNLFDGRMDNNGGHFIMCRNLVRRKT